MTHAMTAMPKYESYKDSGFEPIGNIPEHWELLANRYIFRLKKSQVGKNSDQYDLLSLTLKGVIKRDMENPEGKFPAEFDTYQPIEPGDFIFCLFDVEETPRTVGISPFNGMITGAYTAFKASPEINHEYLHYLYYFLDKHKMLRPLYRGLRNTIPKENFYAFKSCLPPRDEQDRIVAFLNERTVQIDEAIGIKEQQIVLLKERKQIIIQNAVTKGLNAATPMKDSGVYWIGDIPAHWETVPNKRLFSIRKEIVGKKSSDFDLLSLTLKGIIKRNMDNPEGKFPAEFDTYQIVYKDDFVFCLFDVEETPRTVGLSQHYGMITGAYTVMKLMESVNPEYIEQLYIVMDQQKKFKSLYKGLRNTIPKDVFGCIKTPIPPRYEQDEIIRFIESQSRQIDTGISVQQAQIDNLKEYKASLINSAVTGKIKVI